MIKVLYKGYVETKGKQPIEKLKNRKTWKTLDEVKNCPGYAGVLADDVIMIDIDDADQSEILMKIVEDYQLNCKVICTSRGKHFLFKNHQVNRNRTHVPLGIGLTADIKVGSRLSTEVLKIDGEERFVEWDIYEDQKYQELPKWLTPVRSSPDFLDMESGDGRNQALFNYILTLQASDYSVDECRECIRILNRFVLRDPLPDNELETVLRDEAFQKPVFFVGSSFMFDRFAHYMVNNNHIVSINNQLHIYHDGIYTPGYKQIEQSMIELIPNLKKTQRREALEYMELIAEPLPVSDARYIAFRNGIYDVVENVMLPFSAEFVITNKIPWDYKLDAYSELADRTLNRLACQDKDIRALLEECIGFCFYRRNERGKAFILTGDGSNGKSTYLEVVKEILGEENISALDLSELGDRFNTAMMFGKLANIGDDIGDDFLQGSKVAIFKKIVTGNRIKGEYKGLNPFDFNPYIKMLFSANDIPRMKDKTGAVLRRLVIIPFNAVFSNKDPDFDPYIGTRLKEQESIEYLIRLGIEGLKRIDLQNGFTKSEKVEKEIRDYEEENNPIAAFIEDQGEDMILNQPTADVYKRYQVFCADNSMVPMSNIVFSRQIIKRMNMDIKQKKVNGKKFKIYVKWKPEVAENE